ncbi:MAG: hypothetical protein EP347_08965 [Alphaproteobacteria bacterium]|nr:MAG: hypothetical protein EP347_08965 [Alphaproteobacteria bacterium]
MNIDSILLVLAQIAATFAGFTALISMVQRSTRAQSAPLAGFRIMMILTQSIITLFLCLIPFLLESLGKLSNHWTAANLLLVLTIVARLWVVFLDGRRLNVTLQTTFNRVTTTIDYSLASLAVAACITAVLAPDLLPMTATYLFGCVVMLLIAALAFRNLVASFRADFEDEDSPRP